MHVLLVQGIKPGVPKITILFVKGDTRICCGETEAVLRDHLVAVSLSVARDVVKNDRQPMLSRVGFELKGLSGRQRAILDRLRLSCLNRALEHFLNERARRDRKFLPNELAEQFR